LDVLSALFNRNAIAKPRSREEPGGALQGRPTPALFKAEIRRSGPNHAVAGTEDAPRQSPSPLSANETYFI